MTSRFTVPDLGVGVGFRPTHYAEVSRNRPAMDWFEVISENFMVDGGSPLYHLERLLEAYPVIPHGVAMNLGDVADPAHNRRLRVLLDRVRPPWFSDHLCWNGTEGVRAHDLLPVPYTAALRAHLVDRIRRVQDETGVLFALENVSSYLTWRASVQDEWDFVAEVVERADCALLLDVNNVYVSAMNHGFDPVTYLDAMPVDRVVQIHLAGHLLRPEGLRLDTHDRPVCDEVLVLYRHAIARCGAVSTLVEWDEDVPDFPRLAAEAALARAAREEVLGV
jgi:uncharacterized protein (UPF0276 family)